MLVMRNTKQLRCSLHQTRVTMSSLPRLSCMLEMATVVRTQEARPRYVLMAALCCPSPWSVMAELKLGQNIQRNRVPVGRKREDKHEMSAWRKGTSEGRTDHGEDVGVVDGSVQPFALV